MRPTDVNSNALLRQYLEESNCEVRSLGKVLGGYDILCAVTGGTKEPAIVITAGTHADELGGVYGALALLRELETEHRLYVIPVRDPFGFEGYRASIHHALGSEPQIRTPADIYQLFHRQGQVLFENGTYIVARIGEMIFAYDVGVDFPTSGVGRQLDILALEDASLRAEMVRTTRVMAPWNLPMPRRGDPFKQAARSMIVKPDGFVGNMNRFFDLDDAPPEVRSPRDLIEEVEPGLVLDLHEGYGRGFYVYKSPHEEPLSNRIASRMGPAVEARGGIASSCTCAAMASAR